MTSITIATIPLSFRKIFGNPPNDAQIYEIWINNIWNVWLKNVSNQDKQKYRLLDQKHNKQENFIYFRLE